MAATSSTARPGTPPTWELLHGAAEREPLQEAEAADLHP
jgi:hypothetical protein